jgi:hypothetical protein
MMRFLYNFKATYILLTGCILLSVGIMAPIHAWGDGDSGMSFKIYADQEHPDLQYVLGESIELIMVVKNISGWPINTERRFSEINLEQSIVITDPAGIRHAVSQSKTAFDMPPPFFWNDKAASPAEILPVGWVRSARIDLADLLPTMQTTPGWYTIEAYQPFVRYYLTVHDDQIGLLGIESDPKNWNGTLKANKLQIFIAPSRGAQPRIQVIDDSVDPAVTLFQVPVKIFKTETVAAINNDLALAWNAVPLLEGTTDNEGYVDWKSDEPCLIEGNYTAIAKYLDRYADTSITPSDTGWVDASCSGLIEKEISFGEEPPPAHEIITVSGSASNYPEGKRRKADFSMDVASENGSPSGWLKYQYKRKWWFFRVWMFFASTEITEVVGSDGNTATIRGRGTVNGAGNYTFEAVVIDNDPDSFEITIKNSNGNIYYSASPKNISDGDLKVTIGEEPPPVDKIVTVSGAASNYPDGRRHKADFSMDVTSENGSPSGWLKYQYKRKWWFFRIWMFFASTEITEVVGSDGNTAIVKGKGTVNGAGNYSFEAVVIDNSPDSFGITIKDPKGNTYYSAPQKIISDGKLDVTIE